MPLLSRLLVRTALISLGAGFLLGALLLSSRPFPIHALVAPLRPLHVELLLIGWLLQLALGVAYWILPRNLDGPMRGNSTLGWWVFGLLNAGVWLTGLGPVLSPEAPLVVIGRLEETCAVVCFLVLAWPRIRPFRPRTLPVTPSA